VTNVRAWWYRDDAAATGTCSLNHGNAGSLHTTMATVDSNSSSGAHVVDDNTITDATIDNSLYTYNIEITLDPNDNITDVELIGVVITYTIATPLP
jgi:hypothetical protein